MKIASTLAVAFLLAVCGGEEAGANVTGGVGAAPASAPASPSQTMPDWFHVNEAGKTVHMTITAGLTDAKSYWNFNGGHDGNMTITVPEGYTVTIDLVNQDPNMAHSLGIAAQTEGFGAMLTPEPVFDGAITSNPTSMMDATLSGEKETIQFVASTAGEYSMVCYIPAHAATGMWVYFTVSSDGSFGVEGP